MNEILNQMLEQDARLSGLIRRAPAQSGWFRLAAILAHSGDSWLWLAGLGFTWLLFTAPWRQAAALMGIGVVVLAAVVMTIKLLVRRPRPAGDWGMMYRSVDPHSFPSGHAARAFLLVVLAWSVAPTWFALILTIWAPLVSMARIVTGVHYLSDVLVGSFIGLVIGWLMILLRPLTIGIFPLLF
ncbi:MAG TPA: phosphatase PAP2 family protein [Anaerolineaceae bacterium]